MSPAKKNSRGPHKSGPPSKMPLEQKKIYDKLIRKGLSEKRAMSFSKNAARRVEVAQRRHKAAVDAAKKGPPVRRSTKRATTRRKSGAR